jgi:hypothetical protein
MMVMVVAVVIVIVVKVVMVIVMVMMVILVVVMVVVTKPLSHLRQRLHLTTVHNAVQHQRNLIQLCLSPRLVLLFLCYSATSVLSSFHNSNFTLTIICPPVL